MNTKADIRKYYLSAREALSTATQALASQKVYEKISSLALFQETQHVGLYQSIGKEINLQAVLLEALKQHKQVYLPVVQSNETLCFVEFKEDDRLTPNRFNILEPAHQKIFPTQSLDILFMPLVAFDKTGTRLGRGKGYYDKTLMHHKPKKIIGVAYAFQCYPDALPFDAWDVPLDGIITEASVMWFNSTHPHPPLPS